MLLSRNYNKNIIKAAIMKAKLIPREEALKRVPKKDNDSFISKNLPEEDTFKY